MSYDDSMDGALFKNDRKQNEKQPDYTGVQKFEGKEYQLAAWLRESKSGKKYMKTKISEKRVKESQGELERIASGGKTVEDERQPDFNDDIPF